MDTTTPIFHGKLLPHVLMVSNHWQVKKTLPFVGVFVDRQIESLKRAGVEISTFDVGTSHSPFAIFQKWLELRRQVRKLNPHLVHGQYGTIVGILSVLAGRPAVISFCGNDLLPGASVSALRMRLGFLLSNLAALLTRGIICKTDELRQALWWRRDRALVIPNGVDLELFSPGSQIEARKELGWDAMRRIVLINAAGDPERKGLDLAERAMVVTRSRVPNAELNVITCEDPAKMPSLYRAADVLLCASKIEGSPNVVKEALACNLPVVSSPVGDVAERLAGVYPSMVVPRDPGAMGEALAKVLHLRQRSNGREHMASLSSDQVARRIIALYLFVLRANSDDMEECHWNVSRDQVITPTVGVVYTEQRGSLKRQ